MFGNHRLIVLSCLIVFLSLAYSVSYGQSSMSYQWYLNANGGISQLYGDVQNENNHFSKLSNETGFGYGARLGKYIGPVFSVHLQFLKAEFVGQKDKDDLKFSSDLMEYQLGTTVNLINLFFKNKERRVNLYATTGVGAIFFRSEARRLNGNLVSDYGYTKDVARDKTTREISYVIPVGAGLDIKLANRWYLNLESVLRFTFTDKLDAIVSGSHNDAYYYTSMGISFNMGRKKAKEIFADKPETVEIIEDPFANENVNLIYNIPRNLKSLDEFEMRCEIHKGKIDGAAELTQILPIGFEVLDTVIGGVKVEFKNYTLRLNWDELPKDSIFQISYKVKLDKIYGKLPLTSLLYINKTNKDYRFKTNVTIERYEPELVVTEPEPIEEEEVLPPAVEFRVQVRAAYKAKIPLQRLANKYSLREEIKEDYIGNWYKYSIGSFDNFDEAKEYRKAIIGEHGVRDAFIVAFFEGKRLNDLSDLKDVAPDAYPFKTKYKENGPCYRVQILALMKKSITPAAIKEIYNIEEEVNEEVYHNWRKYTVGKCTSKEKAKILRQKLADKGIIDAFIVIYLNGERVTFNGHL